MLGATDWVDGYVARRFHQVSTLGKVLDPVADRLLVVTAVISIMVYGAVPVWFGVATLAREVWCRSRCSLLAALGAARIDVLWVGKAGTFALMFAYPLFLVGDGTAGWQQAVRVVAWVTGMVGLTLAWSPRRPTLRRGPAALADGRRDGPRRRVIPELTDGRGRVKAVTREGRHHGRGRGDAAAAARPRTSPSPCCRWPTGR